MSCVRPSERDPTGSNFICSVVVMTTLNCVSFKLSPIRGISSARVVMPGQ